tara:strand:+ start:2768 stop:3004 length:237 start_codon:yes stop_codon:yes gene_type:complete
MADAQELCCVADCVGIATDYWLPSVCAVRETGVEVGYMPVCTEHDIELNNYTTRMFFGTKYDDELSAYAKRRRATFTL